MRKTQSGDPSTHNEPGSYRQISKQSDPEIPDVLEIEDLKFWVHEVSICTNQDRLWKLYDLCKAKQHWILHNHIWVRIGVLEGTHGRTPPSRLGEK